MKISALVLVLSGTGRVSRYIRFRLSGFAGFLV